MTLSAEVLKQVDRVVASLGAADSILFVTGAGISADSGLSTYRGIGGLYNDTTTDEDIPIEVALSGQMLEQRPEVAWKYIAQIEGACRGAVHNRGHEVIAEMEAHFERVWVLTQNVDGFHRAAGSKQVIDIHGDVHLLECTTCRYQKTVEDYSGLQIPPACPECGDLVRPDVVLFGEMLPRLKLATLMRELDQGFDMVFSIGTTSVFPYIAQPVLAARQQGIPTVEINPGRTEVSFAVDTQIAAGAAAVLDAVWARYRTQA